MDDRVLKHTNENGKFFYIPESYVRKNKNLFLSMHEKILDEIGSDPNLKFVEFKYDENKGGLTIYLHTQRCAAIVINSIFEEDLSNADQVMNASIQRWKELPLIEEKEQYEGIFQETGKKIKFNRVWSDHYFTDEECNALLAGKHIQITYTKKNGQKDVALGKLKSKEYEGVLFYGFQLDGWPLRKEVFGQLLTKEQYMSLKSGEIVLVEGLTSKKGKKFNAYLTYNMRDGVKIDSFA